jgi:[protein-PII] uridylyltransferase
MENPGGLADINAIRAACRFAAEALNLEDAIFQGYLHRRDVDSLHQAEKTFARLLALLQISPGEESTVLSFEGQELLADKLGYSARSGFLPVEAFMQQVWQLFHEVCRVSEDFWERVEEGFWEGLGGKPVPEEPIWLETGLEVRPISVRLASDCSGPDSSFFVAARRGLSFQCHLAMDQHHRNVLDTPATRRCAGNWRIWC